MKKYLCTFLVILFMFASVSCSYAKLADDMTITGTFPKGYTVNNWYSANVTASGGVTDYTFNITSGSLPPGFFIRQDGSRFYLEGIPNAAGTWKFKLRVTDRRDCYAERELSFTVSDEHYEANDMSVSGPFKASGEAGTWYQSYVNVSGGVSDYTFNVSGTLPAGLYIRQDGSRFYLEGIPSKAEECTFKLKITDRRNSYTEKSSTVSITGSYTEPTEADDMSITGDFATDRRVNDSYGSSVYVRGNTGSVTWSLIDGTLPPGLSLTPYSQCNSYIYLNGIPNKAGTYTFKLRATDSRNKYIDQSFTVVFNNIPLLTEADDMSINGDFKTDKRVNDSYSNSVYVSGNTGKVTWSLTSGSLPPGLSLQQNNFLIYLQGIPNKAGTYTFTLRATDSRNKYTERPFTVTFSTPTEADDMSITGDFKSEGQVNNSYWSSVSLEGYNGNVKWSLVSGILPPGLSLSPYSSDYVFIARLIYLEGIPNKAGTYTFKLRATDSRNKYTEREFTVKFEGTDKEAPAEASDMSLSGTLPDCYTVNNWYSASVQVDGGTSDYTYKITNGSLPPGFYIRQDGKNFYVEGIPDKAGTYTFTMRVIDQRNTYAEQEFMLNIKSEHYAASDMSLTGNFPDAAVGKWYSRRVEAKGGVTAYTFNVTSGDLPPGLFISQNGSTFYLEGIPENPGTYTFTLKITDRRNAYVERALTITVNSTERISITTGSNRELGTGLNSSWAIEAAGTVTSWKITQGSLPDGLILSETTGIISGIIADDAIEHNARNTKNYTFEITASNGSGGSASKNFTIEVFEPIKIITESLPQAKIGEKYSATIEVSGTADIGFDLFGFFWTIVPAPSWLKYDMHSGYTLELSGIPTKEGTYSFTVGCGSVFCSGKKKFTLAVIDPTKPAINGSLSNGVIKKSYSKTLKATGGTAPYTWTKSDGTLPAGLTLNKSTGKISGKPTKAGTFKFTVKVTDSNNSSATKEYTVKITKPAISGTLSNGIKYASYAGTLKASGGTSPYTWSVSSGSLPDGLDIDKSAGKISGTPVKAGTFTFKVNVKDKNGASKTKSYTVKITKPSISGTLSSGIKYASYSKTLKASNGTSPYKWSISEGTLPDGLEIGESTGKISGTPTKAGTFKFTVKVTDKNDSAAAKEYAVKITKPEITGTLSNGIKSASYTGTLKASGGTSPYTWTISEGALPDGLTIGESTGKISGTPTKAGTFNFTVKIKDKNKATAVKSYTVKITKPSISGTLSAGAVGKSYSKTLKATGGTASYKWTKASGTLPSGLKLGKTTGKISGTPTEAGKFTFKIKVTDANGVTATKSYTVTIKAADASSSENAYVNVYESLSEESKAEDENLITEEEKENETSSLNNDSAVQSMNADPETHVNFAAELQVMSNDVISQGTGRYEDLVNVRVNQPVRFIITAWPREVSDERVYLDDELIEDIKISEGMFTLPAEFVHDDFKVYVKARAVDSELESEELYISATD